MPKPAHKDHQKPTAKLSEYIQAAMTELTSFDEKRKKIVENIEECLRLVSPHIKRLSDMPISPERSLFKVNDELGLEHTESGARAVEIVKSVDSGSFNEVTKTYALTNDEIADKYGDLQFADMICNALDKKRSHYEGINERHRKAHMTMEEMRAEAAKPPEFGQR